MRSVLLILTCLGLAGCLGTSEFTAVQFFDLPMPDLSRQEAGDPLPQTLHVGRFGTLGPYGTKMVHRVGEQQLSFSEYFRWAQDPSDLVSQQLYLIARQSGQFEGVTPPHGVSGEWRVQGDILRFERTTDGRALVELELTLMNPDQQVRHNAIYREQREVSDSSGKAFADAMGKAVDAACRMAIEDIAKAMSGAS